MLKLIGILLIVTSIVCIATGAMIDLKHNSSNKITINAVSGKVVSDIVAQSPVSTNFFDYLEAILFSYSIISLFVGVIFIFRA